MLDAVKNDSDSDSAEDKRVHIDLVDQVAVMKFLETILTKEGDLWAYADHWTDLAVAKKISAERNIVCKASHVANVRRKMFGQLKSYTPQESAAIAARNEVRDLKTRIDAIGLLVDGFSKRIAEMEERVTFAATLKQADAPKRLGSLEEDVRQMRRELDKAKLSATFRVK
jgi:hypothetical protein